jgi:hypothetical protein
MSYVSAIVLPPSQLISEPERSREIIYVAERDVS